MLLPVLSAGNLTGFIRGEVQYSINAEPRIPVIAQFNIIISAAFAFPFLLCDFHKEGIGEAGGDMILRKPSLNFLFAEKNQPVIF